MGSIQHVFILGCKGIPAKYGGFETFVEKLTEHKISGNIAYHVSCMSDNTKEFHHNGAHCFNIKVPDLGGAKAVYYDIASLVYSCNYIRRHALQNPIVCILGSRIGPFIHFFKEKIHSCGGSLLVNPDGQEWNRAKWSRPIRKYWKASERLMVKHADLLICDSRNIMKNIQETYCRYSPRTTFIAYGAELRKTKLTGNDPSVCAWYKEKGLESKQYYLVVGRFVPENNYYTIIREFMESSTEKSLVLITGFAKTKFFDTLRSVTRFDHDDRIKFAGTVYDQDLLKYIRENAYAYIHGHEVGGTNPSLLEALASTKLNLLLNVAFNREVAEDGALYWTKEAHDLSRMINHVDRLPDSEISQLGKKAKQRITDQYSWNFIAQEYESTFMQDNIHPACAQEKLLHVTNE